MKVAIVYFSGEGRTSTIAQALARGVKSAGGAAEIMTVHQPHWEELHAADAIIFGSPTYMGSVAGPMKAFMDEAGQYFQDQRWLNKIAGGYAVSSRPSGDKLSTLQQMTIFATQMGMIWVGQSELGSYYTQDGKGINRVGGWLGLMCTSDGPKSDPVPAEDLLTAEIYGKRIAEAAARWAN